MFKRKKKALSVALAATLAVSLTACCTPSSTGTSSTDKADSDYCGNGDSSTIWEN